MKFSTEEEVIQRANNTEYGLAGAIWTENPDKGVEIAEQLETGTVWVNEFLHLNPLAPFGGHKQSGFGVEYGMEGLKEFTYAQVITVKHNAAITINIIPLKFFLACELFNNFNLVNRL